MDEKCKKILEKQMEQLFKEYKNSTTVEEKVRLNAELCRTAQTLISLNSQILCVASGGTGRFSSQP